MNPQIKLAYIYFYSRRYEQSFFSLDNQIHLFAKENQAPYTIHRLYIKPGEKDVEVVLL